MRAPQKELWGHTWVGWLNLLVLRWFFIRLAYSQECEVLDTEKILFIGTINCGEKATRIYTKWSLIFRAPWRW